MARVLKSKLNNIVKFSIFLTEIEENDITTIIFNLKQLNNEKEEDELITKKIENTLHQLKSLVSLNSITVHRWSVSRKISDIKIKRISFDDRMRFRYECIGYMRGSEINEEEIFLSKDQALTKAKELNGRDCSLNLPKNLDIKDYIRY